MSPRLTDDPLRGGKLVITRYLANKAGDVDRTEVFKLTNVTGDVVVGRYKVLVGYPYNEHPAINESLYSLLAEGIDIRTRYWNNQFEKDVLKILQQVYKGQNERLLSCDEVKKLLETEFLSSELRKYDDPKGEAYSSEINLLHAKKQDQVSVLYVVFPSPERGKAAFKSESLYTVLLRVYMVRLAMGYMETYVPEAVQTNPEDEDMVLLTAAIDNLNSATTIRSQWGLADIVQDVEVKPGSGVSQQPVVTERFVIIDPDLAPVPPPGVTTKPFQGGEVTGGDETPVTDVASREEVIGVGEKARTEPPPQEESKYAMPKNEIPKDLFAWFNKQYLATGLVSAAALMVVVALVFAYQSIDLQKYAKQLAGVFEVKEAEESTSAPVLKKEHKLAAYKTSKEASPQQAISITDVANGEEIVGVSVKRVPQGPSACLRKAMMRSGGKVEQVVATFECTSGVPVILGNKKVICRAPGSSLEEQESVCL